MRCCDDVCIKNNGYYIFMMIFFASCIGFYWHYLFADINRIALVETEPNIGTKFTFIFENIIY